MKMNKRHLFLGILGLLSVLILCGYLYLNQSHRNIQEEKVRFRLTSSELEASFRISESETKIADQVIQTTGKVTSLDEKSANLDKKVEIRFMEKLPASLEIGMEVTVKGRCVGYDDLLGMVKIDQAMLIEP